jgi:hypothetical protein
MSRLTRTLAAATIAMGAAYATYAAVTWLRYGKPRKARGAEADPELDRFMPRYDVVERRTCGVPATAERTLRAACAMNLANSGIARTLFTVRAVLLGGSPASEKPARGLLAEVTGMGWGVLADIPGKEIVIGAVTQPWQADVVFRAIPPAEFAGFEEPGYVKIAWTLRADATSPGASLFRTETRALACDPVSRSKFRKYWALLSPGIILIRLAMLRQLRREAVV